MLPESVPYRLYLYSIKLRDLLQEQLERLQSETTELREKQTELQQHLLQTASVKDETETQKEQARAWARRWKQLAIRQHRLERDKNSSAATSPNVEGALKKYPRALAVEGDLDPDELDVLLQTDLGRALLRWREDLLQSRHHYDNAEESFIRTHGKTAPMIQALTYDELIRRGDQVFERLDQPLKLSKRDNRKYFQEGE